MNVPLALTLTAALSLPFAGAQVRSAPPAVPAPPASAAVLPQSSPAQPVPAQPASTQSGQTQSGQAQITGLALLPGGTRALCVGSEVRRLSPAGEVLRRWPLREPCLGLQASPSGERLLTWGRVSVQVWGADGERLQSLFMASPGGRVAFLSDAQLLLGMSQGLQTLDLGSGQRAPLSGSGALGAITGVAVSPTGDKLLLGNGTRLNLVRLSDFKILSGIRCEEACPLHAAQFSRDGRGAVALAGQTLYALREGRPVNVVLRGLTQPTLGFPLADGGVWVWQGGRLERRDAQTGRREAVLLGGEMSPAGAATWTGTGGLLLVTPDRQLLELGPDGKEVGRQPLNF